MQKCFDRAIGKWEEYLLVTSLAVNVILVFAQVIMRYVFRYSLSWTEELARYIFVWQIWLGASLGVKYRKHIRVELINSLLSVKWRQRIEIVVLVLWLIMTMFLSINGQYLVELLLARKQLSPALRLPMGYMYASVPVGCFIMSLRLLQELFKQIRPTAKEE